MKHPRIALLAAALAGLSLSSAFAHSSHTHGNHAPAAARVTEETPYGQPGDPKKVSRTITVEMADTMRFSPATITVQRGETVRIRAVNKGKVLHELVLGTPEEIRKHWEAMKRQPNMAHDEPHMVHVDPGQRGELVWQFTRAGEFQFACLLPGHFEAGMVGKVVVR